MELTQIKAIVTGGSSGIGYETAKLLKSKGVQVVICGRNTETLNKTQSELSVHGIQADVAVQNDVDHLFNYAIEQMGGLNVLINNAGIGYMGSLIDTPADDFIRIWQTNTLSTFMCGRRAAQHFIAQNNGNIIDVASMGAVNGFANGSIYCSSKSAITGLTKSWQAELRKHNIRVMQVNPSEVITDFVTKLGHQSANPERKLKGLEIAQVMVSMLELSDIGFVPEANIWATNP